MVRPTTAIACCLLLVVNEQLGLAIGNCSDGSCDADATGLLQTARHNGRSLDETEIDEYHEVFHRRAGKGKGGYKLKLAETAWPIAHGDVTNPGSYAKPSQVDMAKAMIVSQAKGSSLGFIGRTAPITVMKGNKGIWWTNGLQNAYALEETKDGGLTVVAEMKRGDKSEFHGSYAFVDDQNRFYAAFETSIDRFALDRSGLAAKIKSEQRDFSKEKSWIKGDNFLTLNVAPSGLIISATREGVLFVASSNVLPETFAATAFNTLEMKPVVLKLSKSYRQYINKSKDLGRNDDSLWISNSLGMAAGDASDVVLVTTAWGVLSVRVKLGEKPKVLSWWEIQPFVADKPEDAWFLTRLGPFGVGSSPTSFALGKKSFVAVTDGLSTFNLKVKRTSGKSGFFPGGKEASMKVLFGKVAHSTSEQSVSGIVLSEKRADLVVVSNWFGQKSFDKHELLWSIYEDIHPKVFDEMNAHYKTPKGQEGFTLNGTHKNWNTAALFTGACAGGVNLYSFDGEKEQLKLMWSNLDVCSLTGIPLQTMHRIWVSGTTSDDRTTVSLIGLDRKTGKVAVKAPIPRFCSGARMRFCERMVPLMSKTFASNLGGQELDKILPGFFKDSKTTIKYMEGIFMNINYAGVETDGDSIIMGAVGGVLRGIVDRRR